MKIKKLSHFLKTTTSYRLNNTKTEDQKEVKERINNKLDKDDAVKIADNLVKKQGDKKEKIEHIKEKIKNNEYSPPADKVARKVARELFL